MLDDDEDNDDRLVSSMIASTDVRVRQVAGTLIRSVRASVLGHTISVTSSSKMFYSVSYKRASLLSVVGELRAEDPTRKQRHFRVCCHEQTEVLRLTMNFLNPGSKVMGGRVTRALFCRSGCMWSRCCLWMWRLSCRTIFPCIPSTEYRRACGMFTKILHCVYLAMRGKNVRACRWFRQARQPLLTACGRVAKSARCCLPRPSRRFCETFDGTMDSELPRHHCFCLRTFRRSALFFPLMCSCLPTRLSSRSSPSSWPDTASFRSCLFVPPGLFDTLEAGNCAGSRA